MVCAPEAALHPPLLGKLRAPALGTGWTLSSGRCSLLARCGLAQPHGMETGAQTPVSSGAVARRVKAAGRRVPSVRGRKED